MMRILIFKGNMPEKVRHGFFVVNSSYGFCKQNGDVDRLDFVALKLLQIVGHCIRNHNL